MGQAGVANKTNILILFLSHLAKQNVNKIQPPASFSLFQSVPQAQDSPSPSRQFSPSVFHSQPACHNSRPPPSSILLEAARSFFHVLPLPFVPIRAVNIDIISNK